MTEAEWQTSTDLYQMLKLQAILPHKRKRRLFANACCRRIWARLSNEGGHRAVETSELYVEGMVRRKVLIACRQPALASADGSAADSAAASVARAALAPRWIAYLCRLAIGNERKEAEWQSSILRDIFGNPFRPAQVQDSLLRWNDRTVPRIAQGIYEERAFDRLPILHDALLDAGCDNDDILAHCRGAGPHVRGCWIIDLILGKN